MSDFPRKLIEVALPLEEINVACKQEKARTHGTIRNIHKWFAPMPLPAWRALIFASLIDDPEDDEARAALLDLVKRLVANGGNLPSEETMEEARLLIQAQYPLGTPPVLDPFCGGGSTLVEAQRLGLATVGSDLNPVPALISRAITQVLPRTFGEQPIHPKGIAGKGKAAPGQSLLDVSGAQTRTNGYDGLAEDVAYYAQKIKDIAWSKLAEAYSGREAGEAHVAWLWVRTAMCQNPACAAETLLATSWWVNQKRGDLAWLEPRIEGGKVTLDLVTGRKSGGPPEPPKTGRGASFLCLVCGNVLSADEIRTQAASDIGLGMRMTAVVSQRDGERVYRLPSPDDVLAAHVDGIDITGLDLPIANDPRSMWCYQYGVTTWDRLYTKRQLLALTTFADLVAEVPTWVSQDGGTAEWGVAVATMLGLAVGRMAAISSTQTRWRMSDKQHAKPENIYSRNDLPMLWDFAETNPFGESAGSWDLAANKGSSAFAYVFPGEGSVVLSDARTAGIGNSGAKGLVATDPPYFDAIGYADLSDFFYVWHRRCLRKVFPDLYATAATPKQNELTALPHRHGNSKALAREYFIEGFTETFENLQRSLLPGLPLLVVYASKEQKGGSEEETRWSSILTAMVQAGLEITGAWPIHGTGSTRMVSMGTNAVATYVVMVSRPRPETAATCSLQDFTRALRRELKPAVHDLQAAGILPVDLAQAAMGPGMQVYSRHKAVLDQTGQRVTVDEALRLINQALSEVLDEQEGELDPSSRFAVTWWEKHHWNEASFGEADKLARPKGVSVDAVVRSGVAEFPRPGFVRLRGSQSMDRTWLPAKDSYPTAWEYVHHLVDRLVDGGGIGEAGALMRNSAQLRDQAQSLVYRLHAVAARQGWTQDQERYNALIGSWSDLLAEAGRSQSSGDGLF